MSYSKIIAPISLTLAIFITSCSESKTSQCQKLITTVNQGISLIDTKKGQQVSTSLQLSKDLHNTTKSLEKLKLKDPQLTEYQNKFVKIFDKLSQSIAKASKALGDTKTAEASVPGRITIKNARKQIDATLTTAANTAGKDLDNLGKELNTYCSQPK
ncbi:hypothetical protein H6F32_15080 [Anabaena sp. FACHB-1237]|uniref:hypothetical protein n=1 Tax=Anabaena sp. FACHB-1237 TaxID=2692769 RepID=UPI0016817228|nr:hypothetical protein [Anabaena sp. FACHB-1237]MBD2138865.1 hypothetical protein [Anabaena sp. FACHB-1237]